LSTWIITPDKYLHPDEVKKLRTSIHANALLAKSKGRQMDLRAMVIIELGLSTGLRVGEMSKLKVEDLQLKRGQNSLIVRSGKGGKTRVVQFGVNLKNIILEYLEHRSTDSEYLFASERQKFMSVSALQKVFKKASKKAGLPTRYSIHALRHTFCTMLYKASGYNLRLVSLMAGHSSPNTTAVYAAVVNPDIEKAFQEMDSEGFLDSIS
jgi:integrase/recombinase XerD